MLDFSAEGTDGERLPDAAETERLVAGALELPAEARPAFVDSACESDPKLRAEVLSLLEHADAAGDFFGRLAQHLPSSLSGETRAMSADSLAGSTARRRNSGLPAGSAVGRYRILERIGAGGMGAVYRAHDPDLDREVALKLPPLHLAADPEARDRFLVEARAAAALDHPDVCTIHEVGETEDGRPFLAMTLYRGETLKERVARGPLPVEEAVRIAIRITRGLVAAHARGVVHRDVKPGNVMLTEDGAVKLLDFGLARMADVTLTSPGLTPGTVAYMAPERVRGERADGRSDLWSLGVVLYEMLAGRRPFRGDADRAVFHAIEHREPEQIRDVRPEVPEWLALVVHRTLRKDPALRYGTAKEILVDLRTERAKGPRRSRLPAAVLAAVCVAGIAVAASSIGSGAGAGPDERMLAVAPFRVTGAEASLGHLREGMVDLLATRLSGEENPRTVDPRTLIEAWHAAGGAGGDLPLRQARALARDLGAGRLITGEVVSLPGRVVLTASLHDVSSGEVEAPVSVQGPVDSLPGLVDRMVSGLLSLEAGEGRRLASLMTSSPAALRLYLEGQRAFRHSRHVEAMARFSAAVEHDSTFALASLMAWRAAMKVRMTPPVNYLHSWRHRDRLGERDRAFLEATVGPNHPNHSSHLELASSRGALVRERPDEAEAWFGYAEILPGTALANGNVDSVMNRTQEAFARAFALDSTFLPALEQLSLTATWLGDTAEAARYERLFLERSPTGLAAETMRCRRAVRRGGLNALPAVLARLDSVGADVANRCLNDVHRLTPEAAEVRDSVAAHLRRKIDDPAVLVSTWWILYVVGRDGGRPEEVESHLAAVERAGLLDPLRALRMRVADGIWWDGDEEASEAAADRLESALQRIPADSLSHPVLDAICALGQWKLATKEGRGVAPLIARLRALGGSGEGWDQVSALLCANLLETWRAAQAGAPDLKERIARLDSSLVHGPIAGPQLRETSFLLARMLEDRGDPAGALQMLRRSRLAFPHVYQSTYLRESGRLAALLGDTAAAVEAVRRYLAMRTRPESALQPEVREARVRLERLKRPR